MMALTRSPMDHALEFSLLHNRQVADSLAGHAAHALIDGVLRRDGGGRWRHDFPDEGSRDDLP